MENGTILFTVALLSAFIFLSGLIPNSLLSNLIYNNQYFNNVVVPERWDTSAIGQGNITSQDQANITKGSVTILTLLGEDIRITWYNDLRQNGLYIQHDHYWWIFLFPENTNLFPISRDYLNSINQNNVSSVTCYCLKGDFQFLFQVSFNVIYNDLIDAWDSNNLMIWGGTRASDNQTQAHYDAWSLVGQLLTFQSPNINPYINFLIAIPIWISIIIAVIYILDKILPF